MISIVHFRYVVVASDSLLSVDFFEISVKNKNMLRIWSSLELNTCADPECFASGGPTLTTFFFFFFFFLR